MPAINKISITWDDQDRPEITVTYGSEQDDGGVSTQADPQEWLEALAWRLTDESAENLRALIDANDESGAISLAELAEAVGVETKKIEAWNRGLGKQVKTVVREYGFLRKDHEDGTSQVFDFEWDQPGNRWRYVIPEKFRVPLVSFLDKR